MIIRTPKKVDLSITGNCNLRCTYCSHFKSESDIDIDTELPTEEWLQFFEELNRCAVMSVCLQGGEPFYHRELRRLIDGIVRNRMRFNILSNGTLITDEMSAFLFSTSRCDNVQVSIDGSVPTTHDVCRGDGNFLRAVEGVKSLIKFKVPVTVRVTIHKHNVGDLESIAKLLLEEIGLPSFSTNAASHLGLCRQNAEEIQLATRERSLAIETLLRLNRKYDGRIAAEAGPLAEGRMWIKMERARLEGKDHLPGRGCLSACGCTSQKIAVRADGVFIPCNQLSHIELGRINKDDLYEVWHKHSELENLRKRRDISLNDFEYCEGCEYINYCSGNCPALAYALVGEVNHPSPDACLRKYLREGGKLPEMELV